MHRHFLIFMLLISLSSFAQSKYSVSETQAYINNLLKGNCIIEIKNTKLIVEFYTNGKKYRKDDMYASDIDTASVRIDATENLLQADCKAESADCILRELYESKSIRNYKRTQLDLAQVDVSNRETLRKAYIHLVMLLASPKYKNEHPY